MTDSSDAELLGQFTGHASETAFAALVERHIGLVYSVALRHTQNAENARDIAQAVFIILARKADSLGRKIILPGWLYHTARLTASNWQRAEVRRLGREQEAAMQSTLEEPAPDITWRELAPHLDAAMCRLGSADRDALVLRYFQNRSLAEVGASFGIEERAAQKRVARALEKLRKIFSGRGLTLTAVAIAGAVSANSVQAAPAGLAKAISIAAVAKGVTAGAASMGLANGVLKTMAWSTAKTALGLGLAVTLVTTTAIIATKSPPGMEFKGTLKMVFPLAPAGLQTNFCHFTLWSKSSEWELSLQATNRNHWVYSSPKQTYVVEVYDVPTNGPLNTAEISVFPGGRPFMDREAEHVWLALLSGKTYIGQKLPMTDPGVGMVEPVDILEASGDKQDISPQEMRWINEFPGTRTSRIEGDFQWLASTNLFDGRRIPTVSKEECFLTDADGNRTITSASELVVESASPSTFQPIEVPKIPGRNYVIDYRTHDFSKSGWSAQPRPYNVQNGEGLEKAPGQAHR